MANYSMTPYAFSFTPRNARAGEMKPIDNLNDEGSAARTVIEEVLRSHKSDHLKVSADDETRSLRVVKWHAFLDFTFVEFGVGRAGLVGSLHQRTGTRVPFGADEHNESFIRGIFIFPKGGHEAYWLSERAGHTSAVTFLSTVLVKALREKFPKLTVKLNPVAEWSALKSWANQVQVQELRFDAPRPGGATQAMDVNGIHADVRVTVKPRGSLALSRLVKADGPDRQAVFGFLASAPLVSEGGTTVDAVIGAGWKAQVAFKMPGGRQRSFGLALDESAPTLIYPVGQQGGRVAKAARPSDHEFAQACNDFLTDVEGRLPGLMSVATSILNTIT